MVRVCDEDNYIPSTVCNADEKENFIIWDYQAAGKDWDEGLLIGQKMDGDGTIKSKMTI